ncbi:hypothetical protein LIER_06633 [Lithospermum erythrorhizon]|uniref:Uncharacterized protein n=1 Tax=Lithospermum erythrorhizon TaxID=34254 RepID=A0AAV3P585_LITER
MWVGCLGGLGYPSISTPSFNLPFIDSPILPPPPPSFSHPPSKVSSPRPSHFLLSRPPPPHISKSRQGFTILRGEGVGFVKGKGGVTGRGEDGSEEGEDKGREKVVM